MHSLASVIHQDRIFAEKHGTEVFGLLENLDEAEEVEKRVKREQKKMVTQKQQQVEGVEREQNG